MQRFFAAYSFTYIPAIPGPGVDHGGHTWNTYTDGKKTYMINIVNFHCLEETIKDCDYEPNAINSTTFRYTF